MGTQVRTMHRFCDAAAGPLLDPAQRLSQPSVRWTLPSLVRLVLALTLALPAGLLGQGARPALAAAGDLDPTFGTGGKVLIETPEFQVLALVVQPDGKVVAGGTSGPAFKLTRLLPNGALDPSFGTGGVVTTGFDSAGADIQALAAQPDGKVVAAGTSKSPQTTFSDFALARYLSNGALDPGFGTGGRVVTPSFGTLDAIFALAVQPDGKVVAAGLWGGGPPCCVGSTSFALARYLSNGTLDPSFGVPIQNVPPGVVLVSNAGRATHLVVQPDGKLVAAAGGLLLRFLASGTLDPSFGAAGRVTVDFAPLNEVRGLVLQPNGKLAVAVDRWFQEAHADFFLGRFLPNGTPDPGFGTDGRITTRFNNSARIAEPKALALQPDGKLVVAGQSIPSTGGSDFGLARHLSNGAPDPRFGTSGRVTTDFGGDEVVSALVVQPDGKLVAMGASDDPATGLPNDYLALARYESGGDTSTTSGGRGLGITPRVGIDLTWTEGNQQLGYLVLRDPEASATLPAGSATYTDIAPAPPPALNCYVVAPLGPSGPLGVSDLLCARQGLASPPSWGAPLNYTLRLNESATASLSWSGLGGHLGSLVLAVPFDGRPPRVTGLPASASSVTDATGGTFTCYQLYVVYPSGSAQTDLVCGQPGVAQFPATMAEAGAVQGRARPTATTSDAAAPAAARAAAPAVADGKRFERLVSEGRAQIEREAGKLRRKGR